MVLIYKLLYWLTRPFIRASVVKDEGLVIDEKKDIHYVLVTDSLTDKLALEQVAKKQLLPSPFTKLELNGVKIPRTIGVKYRDSLFGSEVKHTKSTISQGKTLLEQVSKAEKDVQFVPVMICWGRAPGIDKKDKKAKFGLLDLIADTYQATGLRKLFILLFSGRHNFVRISKPVSLLEMTQRHGDSEEAAHKLLRVARIHFERQRIVATGPKIMPRQAMFNSLLASPSMKKALQEEAKEKDISLEEAKKNAIKLLDEIAGDYRESYIRFGSTLLTWLWNKIYKGIRVHNADELRDLAQKGHEIVYVPCHRSHMDYLLLTYVIYHQGLVPPHIAAGINLNFWPAGPIFRKAGAFFIRRSFKGSKLYSAVFREYLSQLFIKGYPVKYYTEGGRSRTGRLLAPKTGMIAMTIQAMLRGIDRPITLVPVYIGYEHVMEVNTYLKELKGKNKESESAFGVFKAIKNLKNYGHGDVNFGTPINLNEILNEHAPDWRSIIDDENVVKPSWLTPVVNLTANKVMENVNNSAVLNTVNLSALTLLSSENHALTRGEMTDLIEFFVNLQKDVPYSEQVKISEQTASEMISEAIQLEKVSATSDEYGSIISLDNKNAILMSYYRNNVIHLFALPSVVAGVLLHHPNCSVDDVIEKTEQLYPLIKNELFLTSNNVRETVLSLIEYLKENKFISIARNKVKLVEQSSSEYFQLVMLSKLMKDTLQRFALGFNRLTQVDGISRSELEADAQKMAKRLLTLHDIKAPEYFDKKLISSFVSCIKEQELVDIDEAGLMRLNKQGKATSAAINSVLNSEVLQSLQTSKD
jgi:glycerol-3-phosphate O-acyltransferase